MWRVKGLPTSLYTAAQVRELDRIAIEEFKIPGATLMERAGKAAFDIIQKKWPKEKKICVVCGTGNNGGDGFVVARLLAKAKKDVHVMIVGDVKKIKGAALTAYQGWKKIPLPQRGGRDRERGGADFSRFDLLLDALFGSGLDRPITGIYKKAIVTINKSGKPILAIDVPSGLNADTGSVMGAAVRATATVSFIGLKQGCFTNDGPDCCGEIYFNALGVPKKLYTHLEPASLLPSSSTTSIKSFLSTRKKNSHKGHYGHVLVIGGSESMMGAALLSATAALRMGAGLVSLATDEKHAAAIVLKRPEIMAFDWRNSKILCDRIAAATMIAIGPGLGQSPQARRLLAQALKTKKPLVVDADALNLLARRPIKRDNWILTPHPGEAARLLGCTTSQIQRDRFSSIKKIQKKFGGVIVLKGCGTLIRSPQKLPTDHCPLTTLCPHGNPKMATGGMGDVLTGIIAGLVAQGLSLEEATKTGVFLHAKAGDKAARKKKFILASDLL